MASASAISMPTTVQEILLAFLNDELTICGIPKAAVFQMVLYDSWFQKDYDKESDYRHVSVSAKNGDITVVKHNGNVNIPTEAIFVRKQSKDAIQAAIDDRDKFTVEMFAAFCFSIFCNKGPILFIAEYISTYGAPEDELTIAKLSHLAWLVCNQYAIENDDVFKTICQKISRGNNTFLDEAGRKAFVKTLSRAAFLGDAHPNIKNYFSGYEIVFAEHKNTPNANIAQDIDAGKRNIALAKMIKL